MFVKARKIVPLALCLGIFLVVWRASAVQAQETKPVDLKTVIVQVANRNLPAVVYIEVTEIQEVVHPHLPFDDNPYFRRFFGVPKIPRKFKEEMKGLGSGMIIDPQGYILTNYHVAGGATKIEVTLADGGKYPAKLVGGDSKTDLAVIEISAKNLLPHVTFGDSDKVEVGEWVVAIGAPRALEKSVTQGIISAKHRRGVTDPTGYQDFLQTDAAINPGNSGGPLLNLYGEVVGVNAAIATESGGFEGIGFTIPSNMAQYVAKALIAHGKVDHLELALEYFLKKDEKRAASEIRKEAALLKLEVERATEEGKEMLTASIQELEKLADELERGLLTPSEKIKEVLNRVSRALASHHQQKRDDMEP